MFVHLCGHTGALGPRTEHMETIARALVWIGVPTSTL